MTDRVEHHDVSEPPRIDVSSPSGDVTIEAGESNRVTVALSGDRETVESTSIDVTPDSVVVRLEKGKRNRRFFQQTMDITITAPEGGSVRIGSGSGDARVRIAADEVEVNAGSGDVHIDRDVGDARVKVASGRVVVAHAERDADVMSASGDVKVGYARDARINTASGSILLGTIDGSARIKSASGEVRVKNFTGSDLDIATMSGDVVAGLAAGRTVSAKVKTLSGDFRNRINPSDGERTGNMTLVVKSFSGDVTLQAGTD